MRYCFFLFLIVTLFQTTVQAVTVEDLSKTVVLLRQQQQVGEMKDGKLVEVWYRNAETNQFEPKLAAITGTGFIILYHGVDYLVTAKHIAKELTLPSAEIVMNISGGKSTSFSFDWLAKQEVTRGAKWFHHPSADISIYPLVYLNPTIIDQRAISPSVFPNKIDNIPLLTPAYILGFPKYQGIKENLSPLAKKTQIASKITSVNANDISPELKYIFLDEALAQGYSGAPVFYFEPVPSGIASGGKQKMIDGGLRLLGIQSSDIPDDTGGKLSLVVPIQYLWEILESAEFIKYEKSQEK